MKRTSLFICVILSFILIIAALSGCTMFTGNKNAQESINRQDTQNQDAQTQEQTAVDAAKDNIIPKPAPEEKELTLYFGSSDAMAVAAEKRKVSIKPDEPVARYVIEELIKGPAAKGLYPVMSKDTRLLSIKVEGGTCIVDFSKEFVDKNVGGTAGEAITINSVVNSLTELEGIERVQFLIEGKKRKVFTHAIFDQPFERNDDMIKK